MKTIEKLKSILPWSSNQLAINVLNTLHEPDPHVVATVADKLKMDATKVAAVVAADGGGEFEMIYFSYDIYILAIIRIENVYMKNCQPKYIKQWQRTRRRLFKSLIEMQLATFDRG